MNRFRFSPEAQRDLEEIWEYIASDNPVAADGLLDDIADSCELIGEQPLLGVEREDVAPGLRFLPVGNYLIFYIPLTTGVEIVRVIHGARDYGAGLL